MTKEMLINVSEGEECRIAIVEDGRLEELYMERTSSTSHVGNIYKGRVTNVEPSIQAAFIDFGLGRNGFLHISDLMPSYFGRRGEEIVESVGKKMARRDRPPIQRCLRRGDDIVVQIIKEGIGTKGPTLSTYLSVPGRILVMMPGMGKMGVSRKIEDDAERRRLRQILDGLKPPDEVGFIIRTAGVGKSKTEIERDLKYLTRLWENLVKKRDSGPGPMELYTEGDLVTRTVRDVFTVDVERIVIDNADVAKRVNEVIKLSSPRAKDKVEVYDEPIPLFHKYGIEREIELMYSRHVPLPSGGSLVIDSTEAIVAIDVNSGKFRDHSDAEMTAFKTDMEAADEIARQLRLRDLGGVIICDFIDLRYERHRHELEQRILDHLKHDRAKTKMLRMSQFGIIEMTRQRMRPSFKRAVYFDCPHCKGAGLVKTPESMSLDVMRRLAIAISDQRVQRIELAVCADVSFYLQNKKRQSLAKLEDRFEKRVIIRSDLALGLDEMKLDLYDSRDGLVVLDELGPALAQPPHKSQLSTRPYPPQQPARGGGRFDNRRQQQGDQRRSPQEGRGRGAVEDLDEERYDIDRDEEGAEEREEAMEPQPQADRGGRPSEAREAQGRGRPPREQDQRGDRGDRQRGGAARDQRPDERGRDERDDRPQEPSQRGRQRQDSRGAQQDRPQADRPRQGQGQGQQDRPRQGPGQQDRPQQDRGRQDRGRQDRGGADGGGADRGQADRGQRDRVPQDRAQQGRGQNQRDRGELDPRDRAEQDRGQQRPPQQAARAPQGGRAQPAGRAQQGGQPPRTLDDDAEFETTEPGNQMAPGDERAGGGADGQGGEEEQGPRRRRRRRRGRRGRGRSGQNGQGEQPPQEASFSGDRVFDESYGDRGAEHHDDRAQTDDRAHADDRHRDDDRDRDDTARQQDADPLRRGRREPSPEAEEPFESMEVEEPVIEADARGRILSETVETTAYTRAAPADEKAKAADADAPDADTDAGEATASGARGRRGGRGRRRKGAAAEAPSQEEPVDSSAPASPEPAVQEPVADASAKPKRATRSRARSTRAKAVPPPAAAPAPAPPARASARIAAPETVIRTGSADRHLVEDEAAANEPTRRPRSYRDLDAIPDEFD